MPDRLLIVEDTKVFAQMLKTLVWQAHGFEADVADSFADVVKILATPAKESYFAAIVDRQLPDAPHGEAIDAVVEAGIPTIVFTGTADEATEEDLWAKNISDYAHKSSAHSVEYVVWMIKRLHDNVDKHVLVVDDSLVARKTMVRLLKTQRFIVHTASSGLSALEILEAYPSISLAIVDCNMDGMNGLQLTSKIREKRNKDQLEIIGMSSHGGRSNSARFIKAGADDYLFKPFIPEEFLCRVNRAVDRIQQYEKLKELNELKNRFLSTAAHDIRGPLSAIYKAAKLLQERDWSQERKNIMLQMIASNSFDMQTLLNELLDFSIIESGLLRLNCEQVRLDKVLLDRIQLYSSEAEAKQLTIEAQFEQSPSLLLDRIKIQQVIDNLLTNAIKYSPANGKIVLSLHFDHSNAHLRIADCGPGIPKGEQSLLFKPYQILSSKSTGGEKQTGLGLVIAKNIVEAHGGRIQYHNAAQGGAIFSVTLPIKNLCNTNMDMRKTL